MNRKIIIANIVVLVSLFLSEAMHAEDLGEEMYDSCWPLDGFYSYIGSENEWGKQDDEGESYGVKATLTSYAFRRIPYAGSVDGVRIRHDRENSILYLEALGNILDRVPSTPTEFSEKYDDCVDGKVVFKHYEKGYQDGTFWTDIGAVTLWLDSDKSLVVHRLIDTKTSALFIFRFRDRIESSYTFRWLIDKSANRQ